MDVKTVDSIKIASKKNILMTNKIFLILSNKYINMVVLHFQNFLSEIKIAIKIKLSKSKFLKVLYLARKLKKNVETFIY